MAEIEIFQTETIEEYPDEVEISRTTEEEENILESDEKRYLVSGVDSSHGVSKIIPLHAFEDLGTARLYVALHFDTGGFSTEETGDRGIPPKIAAEGSEAIAAYLFTQGVEVDEIMDTLDVTRSTVHSYLSRTRSRAQEARSKADE